MNVTLKNFIFFDSNNTSSESEVLNSLENAEEMILQVSGSGTINLTIQAKADSVNGTWQNISSISMNNFGICSSITQTGIYEVSVKGFTAIKILNNGSTGINVYGRVIG